MSNRMLSLLAAAIVVAIVVELAIQLRAHARDDEPAPVLLPAPRPPTIGEQRERVERMFREAWAPPPGPRPPRRTTECVSISDDGRLERVHSAGTGDERWDLAITAAMASLVVRLTGSIATPGLVCFDAPPAP